MFGVRIKSNSEECASTIYYNWECEPKNPLCDVILQSYICYAYQRCFCFINKNAPYQNSSCTVGSCIML